MKKIFVCLILLFIYGSFQLKSHQSEFRIRFAPWKNNVRGAYTLIHDDFGGNWVSGIHQYADTIANNRGIPFVFAIITGQCEREDWDIARQLKKHGHQGINHSMNHKCGFETDWCTAGVWDTHNFGEEIEESGAVIKKELGAHPAFFAFPYDQYTEEMIRHLEVQNYCGARAGVRDSVERNPIEDPFHLNYKAFLPGQSMKELNAFADDAVSKNAWAIREVHGVNDGSWGTIKLEDYIGHMEHLKEMVYSKELWVATLSDVFVYKIFCNLYTPQIVQEDKEKKVIEIDFLKSGSFNEAVLENAYNSATDKTITVLLEGKKVKPKKIEQSGKKINFTQTGAGLQINADPALGKMIIYY